MKNKVWNGKRTTDEQFEFIDWLHGIGPIEMLDELIKLERNYYLAGDKITEWKKETLRSEIELYFEV